MQLLCNKLPVFKSENSVFLGDSFEGLIPADVADFKKAFFYYTVKYGKGNAVT